jgi:hypothetical protein
MTGPTANDSVMMQVNGVGAFVRALLPVRLSGGYSVTFGVWVAVDPSELQRVFEVWWKPEYAQMHLHGFLANELMPWGLLRAPVALGVRDPNQTPYCLSSDDPGLNALLTEEWGHEEVLDALP